MRNIHPAAWIGLLLNIFFAYLLYSALGKVDLAPLTESDRAIIQAVLEGLEAVKPYHLAMLAGQALALGLMVSRLPFGLGLAIFTSLLTMPGSIVYCVGSLLTFYRVRYSAFEQIAPDAKNAREVFKSTSIKRMNVFSLVCLGAFFLCALMGEMDLSASFAIAGLAGLVFLSRAKKHPALCLFNEYCVVTPGLFSSGILLPYERIHSATLLETEVIHFTVETPEGPRTLVWALQTVEPNERRAAVEALGAALASHNVQLL